MGETWLNSSKTRRDIMSNRTKLFVILVVLVCGLGVTGCATTKTNTYEEGNIENQLSLRGVVYKPNGRSMALIGADVFHVGDKNDGWTVIDIQREVVKLENAEGETMELKMKGR